MLHILALYHDSEGAKTSMENAEGSGLGLGTLEIQKESQNLDHGYIKDQ